jgi:predicted transcriptional regulator of viral defense system
VQENIALSILNANNGYLVAKNEEKNGVNNTTLLRMEKSGIIERIAHGLYIAANTFPDRYFITQYRCSTGIFSHLTAMYLHGFSDRVPIRLTMTIPTGMNTKSFTDENIIFYYNKPSHLMLGTTEIKTELGMTVKIFDIERTICDCLRYADKLDIDLVLVGMKEYLSSKQRNSVKLLEYADEFNMRDTVRRYLEVL